jgi:hypothetical protein
MLVDEYGAYSAPLDTKFSEPMGTFSRQKVLKRGKGANADPTAAVTEQDE